MVFHKAHVKAPIDAVLSQVSEIWFENLAHNKKYDT